MHVCMYVCMYYVYITIITIERDSNNAVII
jgi:hypothetical protein